MSCCAPRVCTCEPFPWLPSLGSYATTPSPPRLLAPQVLVATSTLAWGVNTPAHLVVIKGTEFFDAPTRRYVDFPITDVLQVRAGAVWWCGSWGRRGRVCALQGMRRCVAGGRIVGERFGLRSKGKRTSAAIAAVCRRSHLCQRPVQLRSSPHCHPSSNLTFPLHTAA